jgi:hypothetical protein
MARKLASSHPLFRNPGNNLSELRIEYILAPATLVWGRMGIPDNFRQLLNVGNEQISRYGSIKETTIGCQQNNNRSYARQRGMFVIQ